MNEKKNHECEKCNVNLVYQGNLCFSVITNCDQNNKNTLFLTATGPTALLEGAYIVHLHWPQKTLSCKQTLDLKFWSPLSKTFWEVVGVKFYGTVRSNVFYWQFKKTDGLLVHDVKLSLTSQRFDDAIQILKYVISQIRLPLPRTQTSLFWWKYARKGRREGDNGRDVWQILFSRWRQEQWRTNMQFLK